jgi:hypothetical protein
MCTSGERWQSVGDDNDSSGVLQTLQGYNNPTEHTLPERRKPGVP